MDKKYPSDMSDKEWEIIKDEFPRRKKTGGPRRYEIREVVNAVFYTSKGGCSWRMLPNDFPPGKVCMGTSGNGRKGVFGRGFMKSYVRKFQNRPEGIKNPVQGLLIVSR